MPGAVRACRGRTGRDLADDTLAAERAGASRIVAAGRHRTAFVPFAGRTRSTCTPPGGSRT
jgi:galactose-1-phosphate uridylyltransferase